MPFPGARVARAAARLAAAGTRAWCFALVGLRPRAEQIAVGEGVRLVAVPEPPTAVELAAALRDPLLFGALGRIMPAVAAELQIDRGVEAVLDGAARLAEVIVATLRIRTGADLRMPAVSDHSWAALAAIHDGRCGARLLEEAPGGAAEAVWTEPGDLAWAWAHRQAAAALLEAPRFRLALDALSTHHREANRRLAFIKLWVGLEAVLAVPAAEERLRRYVAEALDGLRPGEALDRYVGELRQWLTRVLVECVESGRLPDRPEIVEP
ncbi:MAG TPA: hypothetical protein VNO23_16550 [Candidatus Binatia bacterium]|nr:hypothetical protein [Candidatus Binatia bacterium]